MISSESEYLTSWRRNIDGARSPKDVAIIGGQLADRMSWVFMAGYQAAIKTCFGENSYMEELSPTWISFAVSEDRVAKPALPVTRLESIGDRHFLNGNKSWIAGINSIDALIVKAGSGLKATYWVLPAGCDGLKLTQSLEPSRLPELSQGRASFDNIELSATQKVDLDKSLVKSFHVAEASYILLALVCAIETRSEGLGISSITDRSKKLRPLLEDQTSLIGFQEATLSYSKLYPEAKRLLGDWIATCGKNESQLWQRDLPILKMYSPK